MAELDDRLPGELILASYANQIRDRASSRYVDSAARDAASPLPAVGELAYLTTGGVFQHYDGSGWRDLIDNRGGNIFGDVNVTGSVTASGDVSAGVSGAVTFGVTQPNLMDQWRLHENAAIPAQPGSFGVQGSSDGGSNFFTYYSIDAGKLNHRWFVNDIATEVMILGQTACLFRDGTEANPGISFIDSPDDGIWSRGDPSFLSLVTEGSEKVRVGTDAVYTGLNSQTRTVRDILVIDQAPSGTWGKDGDIAVRI